MSKLLDKYYEAEVVSDEIDPNHAGAVRAKIIGYTDNLSLDYQPFVFPSLTAMQAVPSKGSKLTVIFDQGDINMGKYTQVSSESKYLPEDYTSNYPNVAVSNLGDVSFLMKHDRSSNTTTITHPSDDIITINDFGTITLENNKAYAVDGLSSLPVLTEGTVDVFCCTVFGRGVANQGSEYLSIAHISKASVDAINGAVTSESTSVDEIPSESGGEDKITRSLTDANGNEVLKIEFYEIDNYIQRNDKEYKSIYLVHSDGNSFIDMASKINDGAISVHYLIGTSGISSDGTDSSSTSGLLQCIDLDQDADYDTVLTSDSVIIMIIGNGSKITDYQYTIISSILDTVRYTANDMTIPLKTLVTSTISALNPSKIINYEKSGK